MMDFERDDLGIMENARALDIDAVRQVEAAKVIFEWPFRKVFGSAIFDNFEAEYPPKHADIKEGETVMGRTTEFENYLYRFTETVHEALNKKQPYMVVEEFKQLSEIDYYARGILWTSIRLRLHESWGHSIGIRGSAGRDIVIYDSKPPSFGLANFFPPTFPGPDSGSKPGA